MLNICLCESLSAIRFDRTKIITKILLFIAFYYIFSITVIDEINIFARTILLINMELRHLKYFVAVAKTLNFSEAARQLFITQGTLSQQIQQMEGEMGIRLFDRTKHSVILTEEGEELFPLAIKTLSAAEDCNDRMRDLKGTLTGTLRIGTTSSFTSLLTDTVRKFIRDYPNVHLKIQSETATEIIEKLRAGKLDLALSFKPSMAYDELESEPLFMNSLSAVMCKGHPLSSHKYLTMEDLESHRIVLPGKEMQARRAFDRYLGLDTRKLNVTVEVNDPNLIMDIVQSTSLISVVSSLASYYRPDLVAIPLEGGNYSMVGCVLRRKEGYRKRAVDVFVKMIHDSAQVERICKGLKLEE